MATGERERDAIPTAQWIAAHGEPLGFRTPNVAERSRAMGMAAYLDGFRRLGMDDFQMFNAQGNSFDRAAVALRVREALAIWVAGGSLPRHVYPEPAEVLRVSGRLRAEVVAAGFSACVHPFPRDLPAALLGGPAVMVRQVEVGIAAEDGRRVE